MTKPRTAAAAVLALALTGSLLAPAQAVENSLTISKLPTKTAPYQGKATFKARVTHAGRVVLDSKLLTVKKAGKIIADRQATVQLAPGRYRVTQFAKFRTYVEKPTEVVVARNGETAGPYDEAFTPGDLYVEGCAYERMALPSVTVRCDIGRIDGDGDDSSLGRIYFDGTARSSDGGRTYVVALPSQRRSITQSGAPAVGQVVRLDSVVLNRSFSITKMVRKYSATKVRYRSQALTVKAGKKPRACGTYADFRKVSTGADETAGDSQHRVALTLHHSGTTSARSAEAGAVTEVRTYKACNQGASISIAFRDGHVSTKTYRS